MERPIWAPQGIDLTRPSVARMYDYYLGGSHNFEVDRIAARKVLRSWPELPVILRASRAFMRRAVRYAVGMGVTQFLDIGSGIPTFGNVHEVARAASRDARVVYVDNDSVAVAHSEAIIAGDDQVAVVQADLRRPQDIFEAPETRKILDFDQPIALMMVALMHFIRDEDEPFAIMEGLRDVLPRGSVLILTHATEDGQLKMEKPVDEVYQSMGSPLIMRSYDEVVRFFDGFDLVDPGLVFLTEWHPDQADRAEAPEDRGWTSGYAGFGFKR